MWRQTCVTLALLMCVKDSLSQQIDNGHALLNPRIVGGRDVLQKSWQWMVSLHENGVHVCGGSLITDEWVLTAAHCVNGTDTSNWDVYLGRQTQLRKNLNEVTRKVNDIIVHSSYIRKTLDNDIALLQLSSKVIFTAHISAVNLAAHNSYFPPGTIAWIAGWGNIGVTVKKGKTGTTTVQLPLPPPGTLRKAMVQVYDNQDCDIRCNSVPITNNMICAGTKKGGRGHYNGDSGGPMVSERCSQWVQAGVISWKVGCALPNIPDVYILVSKYEQWITDNVGQNNRPNFVPFDPRIKCPPGRQTG